MFDAEIYYCETEEEVKKKKEEETELNIYQGWK